MIKKTLAIILTVSLFILIANNAFAGLLEQTLDESTLKLLLNRSELIHLEEENGKLKYIDYAIIIDVPLDKVWQVITDFENYPDFIPGQKVCKIINKQGNEMIVESAVEFKFMGVGSTVNYTTKYILNKPELIIFDTKKNRETGRYKFIPIDEGKRVVLFRTKEVDRDNFTGVVKILINKKPEMESSLYLSPLRINMKAIKKRAERS
jgi:ribosome-associated toxin RatA of RatAB toxin-antitoxin module